MCMWLDDKLEEQSIEQPTKQLDLGMTLILHIDGTSNSQGSRAGLILTKSKGMIAKYALHFLFKVTNNHYEYKVLLAGLKLAKQLEVKHLRIFNDSSSWLAKSVVSLSLRT